VTDRVSAATRSNIMRAVKGRGTKPECKLLEVARALGLTWRPNPQEVPGRPDLVNATYRIALFVDGDFWHGRKWVEHGIMPRANRRYWVEKIERNMARDARVNGSLRRRGWCVIRVWESELMRDPDAVLATLRRRVGRRRRARQR
jgi:DNA mismatch endonuclease, patch repair protein